MVGLVQGLTALESQARLLVPGEVVVWIRQHAPIQELREMPPFQEPEMVVLGVAEEEVWTTAEVVEVVDSLAEAVGTMETVIRREAMGVSATRPPRSPAQLSS